MSLVSAKEVAKAINLDKYGVAGTFGGWVLMKILRLSKLNAIYKRNKHLQGLDFLNAILNEFEIQFEIPEEDLRNIPKEGAFITISNHPLGGIDGVLLLKLLLEKRPNFKIMANFLLQRIEPLAPYVMPVNPFENHKDAKSSVLGFKQTIKHLQDGMPLGLFPAGEVSVSREGKLVVDKPWEETAMKLAKKAQVPIIPIYFHAKNSKLFYSLSKISETLRTAKLPSELLTQKKRTIYIRIGKPIPVSVQDEYKDIESYTEFLRKKTYILANAFEQDKKFIPLSTVLKANRTPKAPEAIVQPVGKELIEKEIETITQKEFRLLKSNNYEVFLTPYKEIPNIIKEIGRLRELTFRQVGEGTNAAIDLDAFDEYYYHLFLWDTETKTVVGAYRMGLGSEIFPKYGIDGFYTHSLFRFEPELYDMMSKTIEMGRAFITPEYQQKPMPLFLLWKGIAHTTLRHPEHSYLLGGVSISNQFSNFSKSLMIEFMKSNFYDPYIAQYVRPKKEFKVKLKDQDKDFIFDETKADLNKFDRIIDELEPGDLRLPVLIKKYIKQNAKVIAFNVDPMFNNAIDGLMYIRIADLPESTMKPVIEEFQAELEAKTKEKSENQEK
ncbi:MAG: lysophospholipid acyltransferase family protein [Capnocytophaga sp.]|nr:lysophospholipid acyltransferase family protein [Capnocytophaga sp.]